MPDCVSTNWGAYGSAPIIGARPGFLCKVDSCHAKCTGHPEECGHIPRLALTDGEVTTYLVEATVTFDTNLPHGAFAKILPRTRGDTAAVKMDISVPPKSTVQEMMAGVEMGAQDVFEKQAAQKLTEDGGVMTGQFQITQTKFKGGPPNPSDEVCVGTYELTCSQRLNVRGGLEYYDIRIVRGMCVCCCIIS